MLPPTTTRRTERMAKLSGSIDVPLPPEVAWKHASDLSRYKDWLTIHKVWRSTLPDDIDKGTVVESIVEVKGMYNRIKWTVVRYKPPEGMTLNGDGVGGVKVKLMAKVRPTDDGSIVGFDVHLGGPALFGPIGMIVAAALRSDINQSLRNFVRVFTAPDPGMNGHGGARR